MFLPGVCPLVTNPPGTGVQRSRQLCDCSSGPLVGSGSTGSSAAEAPCETHAQSDLKRVASVAISQQIPGTKWTANAHVLVKFQPSYWISSTSIHIKNGVFDVFVDLGQCRMDMYGQERKRTPQDYAIFIDIYSSYALIITNFCPRIWV